MVVLFFFPCEEYLVIHLHQKGTTIIAEAAIAAHQAIVAASA